ncbi:MAG TPA: endolytic transglycosylase MltG [Acidimicrobiales bacterium]
MTDDWTRDHDPADDWDTTTDDDYVEEEPWAEGEWEDWRPPSRTGRRLFVAALVLLGIVAAAGFIAWNQVQDRIDPPGPPGELVELEIPTGSTTEDIGALLVDNDIITSATIWNYWTRIESVGPFQAGFYEFQTNSSFDEAVAVLDGGPRPPQLERVTIPEGLTVSEILPRLADPETGVDRWSLEALQGALDSGEIRSKYQPPDVTSYEGLLFPDTYEIDEDVDEAAFLRRLVAETDARLAALDVEAKAAALGRTPYEILVIASLIEEESRVPEERPKVARVVYNRLEEGIPLGIDATSRYEAEISGRDREDLDFDSDSRYNTRRVAGIPPTPIAAAGQASLEGALNPAEGDWIYYVLQDEQGNHFFTESFQEFNRAKAECARLGLGCG